MCLEQVIPVLRVSDIDIAKDFYLSFLKFDFDWEYKIKNGCYNYLQISKGKCILHLTEYCENDFSRTEIRIETEDLPYYQQLLSANPSHHISAEIVDMDWGTRDMIIRDPFGNQLTFTTGAVNE